jgi:hypothetical protein
MPLDPNLLNTNYQNEILFRDRTQTSTPGAMTF